MNLSAIPEHVHPELVYEVDVFNIQSLHPDLHVAFKKLQDESPPIFFTPFHGGHWLPTRADIIERVFSDYETFSSHNAVVPPAVEGVPRALPINADGAEHRAFRSFIVSYLIGKPLRLAIERARILAIDLIEGLLPNGQCEFVADFAQHLPIEVFLSIVDLPNEDREYLVGLADIVRTADPVARGESFQRLMDYLSRYIDERIANPGDDLISRIVTGQIDGRPVSREEMIGTCNVVLLGGLDTVASTISFIAAHLAQNPGLRRQLADEPQLIETHIDEIIRRFGVAGPSRIVAKDVEIEGAQLKVGDRVFIASALHGLDEHRWKDPLNVDLSRKEPATAYQTFGSGPHRCPGAALARSEIILFLQEWLKRIPDFELVPGKSIVAGSGNTNGVYSLHLQWPTSDK
jgi:cytochrome P450